MKSSVVKRSIVVAGHKTSVSLEDAFWKGLKEIAGGRDVTLSDLVAAIDSERQQGNLSSAIRLFVLDFYRKQQSETKDRPDAAHDLMAIKRLLSRELTRKYRIEPAGLVERFDTPDRGISAYRIARQTGDAYEREHAPVGAGLRDQPASVRTI